MPKPRARIVSITVHYEVDDGAGNLERRSKEITDLSTCIGLGWGATHAAPAGCSHFFSEFHHHAHGTDPAGGHNARKQGVEDDWGRRSPNPGSLPLLMLKSPDCRSSAVYP